MIPASPTPSALCVEGLTFSYSGKPVLEDVSFKIEPGEFTVLLGPNGAGKTTLFSLITRLYDSRVGKISINGAEVRAAPGAALSRLGVVFQQPTLDLDLTVRQNLLYHAALHGLSRRTAAERMEEKLLRVGMQDQVRARVRQLSGGQRRRIEIARALLHEPALLLLDEPTVGLDIASRRVLVDHTHSLCEEQGVAVLWATHLIDEVEDRDTVIILHRGKIRAHGDVATVTAAAGSASLGGTFQALTEGRQ
ncbi:ABC transporter ATP-binding protein [Aquamicrobium zhengzhouense]|uniref:ABC transporter ATP-binding protein n=1 Tax=Aquamicrobium zhengzhouense TaxID=2781738 RepID=UPI0018E11BA1|nr:ABC transporter ATP-binding protein [Aquamicrobium zhengzhouense]